MRQLQPQVVEKRKKDLLQWVIHRYVKTSRPVASSVIAEESGAKLSSATVRHVLQELEDEGFLQQPHTSSGRVPTDKGYRFFVDYLIDVQRMASEEKEKIENSYRHRVEELDTLLSETSKLLSKVSHGAGLVFSPQMRDQTMKRLELISLSGRKVLAILVTESGMVRHWPIQLAFAPSPSQINILNRFLNEHVKGCSVREAQAAVMTKLRLLEKEFRDLTSLVGELLKEVGAVISPQTLYIDGADNILSHAEDVGDLKTVQSLLKMLGEKRALAGLLEHELSRQKKKTQEHKAIVRIGQESGIPELADLSLVTTTYQQGDRVVGVLGVLGSKRMEYSRMMSLVDCMSDIVSRQLGNWSKEQDT